MNELIDIRDYPEVIEVVNAVLNNKGTAEIKNEPRKGKINLVVVQTTRTVKTKKPL